MCLNFDGSEVFRSALDRCTCPDTSLLCIEYVQGTYIKALIIHLNSTFLLFNVYAYLHSIVKDVSTIHCIADSPCVVMNWIICVSNLNTLAMYVRIYLVIFLATIVYVFWVAVCSSSIFCYTHVCL